MPLPDHIELLCIAIKEQASSQAEKIIQNAQKRANRMVSIGLQALERQIEEKKFSLKRQAFQEARRKTDSAELEARRMVMATKEELFKQALDGAYEMLKVIKGQKEAYKDIVREMIRMACSVLNGTDESGLIVQSSQEDEPVVSQVCKELEKEIHCKISWETKRDIEGGIVVMSQTRKRMVDMTFNALLKRLEPQIRRIVAQKVFVGE